MSRPVKVSAGTPTRLRSFDPVHLAGLEYRAGVGYYLRRWPRVLIASVGLVRVGFGMDWYRTLHGAWLVLRANQLWAPCPGNDPVRAQACMRRFYTLVRLTYGEPANPAKAAELEVDWWRVHREGQHRDGPHAAEDAEPARDLPSPSFKWLEFQSALFFAASVQQEDSRGQVTREPVGCHR